MKTSITRMIAVLAVVVPTASLMTSPVMAASQTKAKHHLSVHKTSAHRSHKKAVSTTAS